MYITIDEADRRPIYRQVADEIKSLIARGELEEGVALPRVRHVAGAVVSSRRSAQQTDAELRKRLRAGLTHLALAGLPKSEVVEIVNEEIRELFRRER